MSTSVPVGQLLLDVENPRHGHVQSQRDAIQALIEDQKERLVKLAQDLGANGASPIDAMIVLKRGTNYIVLEGNRRLAAVRLINNPDLAKGTKYEKDFKRIAKGAKATPIEFECWTAKSRDEANAWIKLRHTGSAGGVGVVPWASRQQQRFELNPETHAGKASMFIDTVAKAYPKNQPLLTNLEKVGEERLTTLGRLIAEPEFRNRLGLVEVDRGFQSHYPPEQLVEVIERVASDLATTLSVKDIMTKEHRLAYLKKLPMPDPEARRDDAQPLVPSPASAAAKKAARKVPIPRPGPVFKELSLRKSGTRLPRIVEEIRKLNPDNYPNAVSVLMRVVLELALAHVYERKRLSHDNLTASVKRCLRMVDPKNNRDEFEAIRVGLADPNSMFAVSTMHAYVHNKFFHPQPAQVRALAANLVPFLEALDTLA